MDWVIFCLVFAVPFLINLNNFLSIKKIETELTQKNECILFEKK